VNGEVHARLCEGLKVKFPGPLDLTFRLSMRGLILRGLRTREESLAALVAGYA